jgi:hypothetical protein
MIFVWVGFPTGLVRKIAEEGVSVRVDQVAIGTGHHARIPLLASWGPEVPKTVLETALTPWIQEHSQFPHV